MSLSAKIAKQIEDIADEQAAILNTAQNAEGGTRDLTAEESAKFDELDASKEKLKTNLKRAQSVEKDKAEAMQPARLAIVQQPFTPANAAATAGGNRVFAQPRRHGTLKAFRGDNAVAHAEAAGMWAIATLYGNLPNFDQGVAAKARNWCHENGVITDRAEPNAATLTLTNNSGAGFFVPTVVDNTIVELMEMYGVVRRNAEIVNMGSETQDSPRRIGGVTAYWVGEQTAPTQTEPKWDQVKLVAKVLSAMSKMTRELNEDSIIDLGDKIAMEMALAFSYAEDNAGFNGDGTSTYGGITGILPKLALTANAASVITAESGNTTPATLDLYDFYKVQGAAPDYANYNPKWYCHKSVWAASMVPLMNATGGATPNDIAGGPGRTFLGNPVEFVQTMPKLSAATSGTIPIVYGDLNMGVKLGNRRGLTVESHLINDDAAKRLMTIIGWSRVDINVHTVIDPAETLKAGPVMGLKLA